MPCEDEVLRVSFIKNLPETINVDFSDRFIVEKPNEGTQTITLENFNLPIENTLFEETFLYHTTAIDELSARMSVGGDITSNIDNVKQDMLDEIDQLSETENLVLSADYFSNKIEELLNEINPDGQGIIEKVDIQATVIANGASGSHRVIDRYVVNREPTETDYISVSELAPERDWKGGDITPQSLGVYVNIVNNKIYLYPTPKALGAPIDTLSVTISGIEFNNKDNYISDVVRLEPDLFESTVHSGELGDDLGDAITFNYTVDKVNGVINLNYNRTGGQYGDVSFNADPTRPDIFDIRVSSRTNNEIITDDTGSGGTFIPDPVVSDPLISSYNSACGVTENIGGVIGSNGVVINDSGNMVVAASKVANDESKFEVIIYKVGNNCNLSDFGFIEVDGPVSDLSLRSNILAVGLQGLNRVDLYNINSDGVSFYKSFSLDNRFGASVSIDAAEEYIAISSRPTNNANTGSVRVYNIASGELLGDVIVSDTSNDGFGSAISLNNSMLAVGGGVGDGILKIYKWSDVVKLWELVYEPDEIEPNSELGSSVKLSNNGARLIVGSRNENNGDGAARAYKWNGTNWVVQNTIFTPSPGSRGYIDDVSINGSGDKIAVSEGVTANDPHGKGRISVFDWGLTNQSAPFTNKQELTNTSDSSRYAAIDFSQNNTLVVSDTGRGNVVIYNNL